MPHPTPYVDNSAQCIIVIIVTITHYSATVVTMKSVLFFFLLTVIMPPTLSDNADPRLTTLHKLDEPKPVKVSKCCSHQESLDVSNPKQPFCTDRQDQVSPFILIKGLDLNSRNKREVDIQLTQDKKNTSAIPACYSDFEVHRVEDSGIKLAKENNIL